MFSILKYPNLNNYSALHTVSDFTVYLGISNMLLNYLSGQNSIKVVNVRYHDEMKSRQMCQLRFNSINKIHVHQFI